MGAYYILAIYPHPYQIPTPISLLIDETPTHVIFYIFILSTSFFTYTSCTDQSYQQLVFSRSYPTQIFE